VFHVEHFVDGALTARRNRLRKNALSSTAAA